ncbi:MAG TPA: CaiB/BaiF CoA-transferase family protein [Burkholderiaceae bacterium]|nr:CaiB/BaiF CoA-transferase family protein [Burkholderiaceae bacterium]
MTTEQLPLVSPDPARTGPLTGVRVVDLSRLVAGNMLTLQLADFGADVIKVEVAGSGDTLREWRETHPDYPDGYDGWWRVYARNKRSVALNLRDPAGMAWLRRLIATAQVLVESFRPGTLEAMGLAPDVLHRDTPGLVIVRVSGWGQSGPYSELPGFGSLIEGFSGFAHKHRQADGVPQLPNLALADMVAGLSGAFAVTAALREVEVNRGRGQVVDLSLLEPMLSIMGPDATHFAATGVAAEPGTKISSPRGVYRCRDGRWVSMSGSSDTMARRVFAAIGQGALYDDPRFSTNAARLVHDAEIERMVSGFIAGMDQAECLAWFRGQGVTVGPIYDAPQMLQDPHVAQRGVYVRAVHDDAARSTTVMHNIAPRLSGTPGGLRRHAPRRGEHTAQLLAELGADAAEIARLDENGSIECG